MNITFRTDASLQIGSGHVMRCLTLANALRETGADCHFISRSHSGHLGTRIKDNGHQLTLLPASDSESTAISSTVTHAAWLDASWEQDASETVAAIDGQKPDWLVIDHYALDAVWEKALRSHAKRIMVIDDLADRRHDADLLLDQNLGRVERDYANLVPIHCNLMIGPQYALLRPEFSQLREYSLTRRCSPALKHLLISMGGVDADNATGQVLEALGQCLLPDGFHTTVAMGGHAPRLDAVRERAAKCCWPCEVRVDVKNMAQLMADSDLAIGAAGTTSLERFCLGLPTFLVIIADNQRIGAQAFSKSGSVYLLGEVNDIAENLVQAIASLAHPNSLKQMSIAARNLCDGSGLKRTVDQLSAGTGSVSLSPATPIVRPMVEEDVEQVLLWRNHPEVRRYMYTCREINRSEHYAWFERVSTDHSRHPLIIEEAGQPLGFVNFKEIDPGGVAEWGFYAVPNAPNGTGKKLGYAALNHAFGPLSFHKICGKALDINKRSINFHHALGFTEEGLLRDQYSDGKRYHAVYCFGLLASEWRRHY